MAPNSFSPCPSCGGTAANCCEVAEQDKVDINLIAMALLDRAYDWDTFGEKRCRYCYQGFTNHASKCPVLLAQDYI